MRYPRRSLAVVAVLFSLRVSSAGAASSGGAFVDACCLGTSRYDHTATLLANGQVLVVGGSSGLSSAELYDPTEHAFRPAGDMSRGRARHTATLLQSGKVLVAGGVTGSIHTGLKGTADLYDPVAGTFSVIPNMQVPRTDHTATLLPSGKVLIAGGNSYGGYHPFVTQDAEIYDPGTGTFAATGRMTSSRAEHTATLLPNGKVLIAGGRAPLTVASAELFDPATGTFTATGSMATARTGHTATLLPNGKVLITGGETALAQTLTSAEIYDPATGAFTATGSMAAARAYHAASALSDGRVLVTGGNNATQPTPNAELYDPATGSFTSTGPMHRSRSRHTSTGLDNGQVLVAGGVSLDGVFLCPELYTPPSLACTQPPQVHFSSIRAVGPPASGPPINTNTTAEAPIYVTDDEPLPEERLQCVAAGASGACVFGRLECSTLMGISIEFKTGLTPGVCTLHFVARDASGMLGVGFAEVQVVP